MGEPGLSVPQVKALVKRYFPNAQVVTDANGGGAMLLTVHSTGKDEYEALCNAIGEWEEMKKKGQCVRTMLDEVYADLRTPGMSRERHDNFMESLELISSHINAGILTGVIPFITVAGLNREIEDLRRRIDARLGMAAADAADFLKSKHHASEPVISLAQPNNWSIIQRTLK